MKTSIKAVGAGIVAVAAVIGLSKLTGESGSRSQVKSMISDLQAQEKAGTALVMGCIQKGMTDERLMPHVMMTNGQVCLQIVGDMLAKESSGKGYCRQSDEKCNFKIGYAKTALVLGYPASTDEEIKALESEADSAFEKSKELRGGE